MAFSSLLAWWQKPIALPILITAMTAVTYLHRDLQVLILFYQYRSAQSLTTAPITGQVYFEGKSIGRLTLLHGKTAIWTSAGKSDKILHKSATPFGQKYLYPKEEASGHQPSAKSDLIIVPAANTKIIWPRTLPLTRETAHVGSHYLFTPAP